MQDSILRKDSFTAAADLSALQFTCVKMSGVNSVDSNAADTVATIGILYNKPTLGQSAEVAMLGSIAKVLVGSAGVTQGSPVVPTTGGAVINTTTDKKWAVGIALDTAVSGDYARVLINPFLTSI